MLSTRLILKIILSLLLGISAALLWFQFDQRFVIMANHAMEKVFESELNCNFQAKVKRLRPFTLMLEFEDICVTPFGEKKEWSWRAQNMQLQLSFMHYLYSGTFGLNVRLLKLRALSLIKENYPSILDHVQDMFMGANFSVPISFQGLDIADGRLKAQTADKKTQLQCGWNNSAGLYNDKVRGQFYVFDTNLTVEDQNIFKDMQGSLTLDGGSLFTVNVDSSLVLPQLPEGQQKCYLSGTWDKDQASFVFYNQERTFSFVPITVVLNKNKPFLKAEGVFLFEYLQKLLFPFITAPVKGMCTLDVSGNLQNVMQGKIVIRDVVYQNYVLGDVTTSFVRNGFEWHGTLTSDKDGAKTTGLWNWSEQSGQGQAWATNRTVFSLFDNGYWKCAPGKTQCWCDWDVLGIKQATYTTCMYHAKTEKIIESSGTLESSEHAMTLKGTVGTGSYEGHFLRNPLWLRSFIYKDAGKEHIKIVSSSSDRTQITVGLDYDCVRNWVQDRYDVALSGHGMFKLTGILNYPYFTGTMHLHNGVIRLAGMYNFVSDILLNIALDMEHYRIEISHSKIKLHQGNIETKQAYIAFDDDGNLQSTHVPLQFSRCFLNWEKYLYAMTSGALVYQIKNPLDKSLEGFITLDKSQFKENIFALKTQQSFLSSVHSQALENMRMNLSVTTDQPVVIATDNLQMKAGIDLTILNAVHTPEIHGSIMLHKGQLHFPGQTLSVMGGNVTFLPSQPDDPLIELVAQGRIKKYLITLSVGGSAKDPHITLNSVPALTEEQIIMLLLTGTEHESFNVMVPTLVMRNIETILLGSSGPFKQIETPFASWLKPLERITFVPRFTDQTGRGGFKGALEIEVSQRLRAVLEKNFSLSEDTAVEVEYLLSDDVSLKFSKDERGDIGAEIEMRFKF